MKFTERLMHAWNVFRGRDPTSYPTAVDIGPSYLLNQLATSPRFGDQGIVEAIMTRIAIDVAALKYHHVRKDKDGNYKEDIQDALDERLNLYANVDQTGRVFIQDIVESLLQEGVVAVVPVDTNYDITDTMSFNIESMRVGRVDQWYPEHVEVNLFNEKIGMREQVIVPKNVTAIIQNPLYSIMNAHNSTAKRLQHKLNLLDVVDNQIGSGKMDLIIQLPYTTKSAIRKNQAKERRQELEEQLSDSKYGVGYIDATEKITQLNRPVENNILNQVQYLTDMLYGQLGITEEVMNGTADEPTMLNYYNRTIEPIASAIVNEFRWKFLTKTARSQGQDVMFFNDPFRLTPAAQLAELADKFTRNTIMSSNEWRSRIGLKPSDDPAASELINHNLNQPEEKQQVAPDQQEQKPDEPQNGSE